MRHTMRLSPTSKASADPVAIARLVRDGQAAEIAFEVANDYEQRGIGTALAEELLAGRSSGRHHRDHRARHGR